MARTTIRRATPTDVPAIERLVAAAFDKYIERIGCKPAPMATDYARELGIALVWVLEDSGGILGVVVSKDKGDHLFVETLAVWPGAQGRGHGRALLARAEQDAAERGVAQIRLYTNAAMTENLEFYPRQGFLESGRAEHEGFHRVSFTKERSPIPGVTPPERGGSRRS